MSETTYGLLKLSTGEEIIGEVDDSTNVITVTAPRVIVPRQSQTGIVLGLMYWIFGAPDDSFIIDKSQIVAYTFELDQDLISAYIKNTTGLEVAKNLPPASSLIKV
jgi:hypothetical protein